LEKDFFLSSILTINDKDSGFLTGSFLVPELDSTLESPFTEEEEESNREKVEYVKEG